MYPAGVAGISVRRITLRDGLALRVLESGPAVDRGVVLVHGWGASVYSFSEMIPALASAGHRVVAMDLPGHGLSDKPADPWHYSIRALADIVLETLATTGIQRCTMVGHSMGGAVALNIAMRPGTPVDRLALISAVGLGRVPLAGVLRALTPEFATDLIPHLLTRSAIRLVLEIAFGTPSRPLDRDVDEYWAPTQFDEFARACRACIHHASWERAPASALRGGLAIPVLVIAGGRDRIVLDAGNRGRLIPGARVVVIPEGGHIVLQECAEIVNRELLAFLGSGVRA